MNKRKFLSKNRHLHVSNICIGLIALSIRKKNGCQLSKLLCDRDEVAPRWEYFYSFISYHPKYKILNRCDLILKQQFAILLLWCVFTIWGHGGFECAIGSSLPNTHTLYAKLETFYFLKFLTFKVNKTLTGRESIKSIISGSFAEFP